MRLLRSALGQRDGPTGDDIALGPRLEATPAWERSLPGAMGVGATIDAATSSVYASDGFGVAFGALRFRRLDLATGEERASFRPGTAVRAFDIVDDDLFAATDSRLFRLGWRALEERARWEERLPRSSSSIVVIGDDVVVSNDLDPKIGVIDLASGKVRRRAAPAMPHLVRDGERALVVGGGEAGGTVSIDPRTAEVTAIATTPPALHAWLSAGERDLWLLRGPRFVISEQARFGPEIRVGEVTRELLRVPLRPGEDGDRYRLPKGVRGIVGSPSRLWLVGDRFIAGDSYLLSVPLPIGSTPARAWTAPSGQSIVDADPASGRVVTGRPDEKGGVTVLTCHQLGEPGP